MDITAVFSSRDADDIFVLLATLLCCGRDTVGLGLAALIGLQQTLKAICN